MGHNTRIGIWLNTPMADIKVTGDESGDSFQVVVSEGGSSISYSVTVPADLYARLSGGNAGKADTVEASFRFLLDRESKESIMRSFDLSVISDYFPEYEGKLNSYL